MIFHISFMEYFSLVFTSVFSHVSSNCNRNFLNVRKQGRKNIGLFLYKKVYKANFRTFSEHNCEVWEQIICNENDEITYFL